MLRRRRILRSPMLNETPDVIFSSPRSNETHLQKLKDLINARGVYVSIGVQAGALNR